MGIGIDNQRNANLPRPVGVGVLQVQAFRRGVYLQGCAGLPGGLQNLFHVEPHRVPVTQQPGGQVADDRYRRVLHRLDDALGHRLGVLPHGRMDRSHHHVQPVQYFVGVVQASVCPNVDLGAAKNGDGVAVLQRPQQVNLLANPFVGQPVGDAQPR